MNKASLNACSLYLPTGVQFHYRIIQLTILCVRYCFVSSLELNQIHFIHFIHKTSTQVPDTLGSIEMRKCEQLCLFSSKKFSISFSRRFTIALFNFLYRLQPLLVIDQSVWQIMSKRHLPNVFHRYSYLQSHVREERLHFAWQVCNVFLIRVCLIVFVCIE